jgi:hypothetical protein
MMKLIQESFLMFNELQIQADIFEFGWTVGYAGN